MLLHKNKSGGTNQNAHTTIKDMFFSGTVYAQSETNINDALSILPPELQGQVNDTQIETIKNQSQQIFREKCEKHGGLAAFEAAQVCLIKSILHR